MGLAENKAQQVEIVQGDLNVAVMDYCDTNEGGEGGNSGNGNQWTIDKIGIQKGVEVSYLLVFN